MKKILSTKMNINESSLSDGSDNVTIISDGSQSIRCWMDGSNIKMLVASYNNMGAEGFFRSHAEILDRPLKPGDYISGSVKLAFLK